MTIWMRKTHYTLTHIPYKNYFKQFFFTVLIVLFSNNYSSADNSEDLIQSLTGQWLNADYVAKLEATRSPRAAIKNVYYAAIEIIKETDFFEIMYILNFHEAECYKLSGLEPTGKPNEFRIIYDSLESSPISSNDMLFFPDGISCDRFVWIFTPRYTTEREIPGKKLSIPFIRTEQGIERYLNKLLLSGIYQDQNGRTFEFTETGEALWPDRSFTYEIGVDYIFAECDYFMIKEKPYKEWWKNNYGFTWNENRLSIYMTHQHPEVSDGLIRNEEPLYVLTPVEKKQ